MIGQSTQATYTCVDCGEVFKASPTGDNLCHCKHVPLPHPPGWYMRLNTKTGAQGWFCYDCATINTILEAFGERAVVVREVRNERSDG